MTTNSTGLETTEAPEATETLEGSETLEGAEEADGTVPTPDMAAARSRRLELIVLTLAGTVAGLLATLALPWVNVTVAPTIVEMTDGSTVQQVTTQGGTVTYLGRDLGATGPVMLLAVVAAFTALAAQRRWWWAIGASVVLLGKAGGGIPDVTDITGTGPTSISLADAATGLVYARWLYSAYMLVTVAAAFQTWLVWKAEKDWAAFGQRLAGAYRAVRQPTKPAKK